MANRIHKILEDANIKLGAVATNIMGVSGRDMIRLLVAGETDPRNSRSLPAGGFGQRSRSRSWLFKGR